MKESRSIQIVIRPVENRHGEHIAYYTNEFLKATFSVHLKDNIFGALALHSFLELVRILNLSVPVVFPKGFADHLGKGMKSQGTEDVVFQMH